MLCIILASVAAAVGPNTAQAAGPYDCGWEDRFGLPGMNNDVLALAIYDDGNGEALFAAGRFYSVGGTTVKYVARWNGSSWSPLTGTNGTGVSSWVHSLAVYDDGDGEALYAGGRFDRAGGINVTGGITVNQIARWDGATWPKLSGPSGTGTNYAVFALFVYDDGGGDALFAGGDFSTAGGLTVNYVARWDGTAWSPLIGPAGNGVRNTYGPGWVHSLAVWDDGTGSSLYAGGYFPTAGGVTVNHVARWDGSRWWPMIGSTDIGMSDTVYSLAVFDDGSGEALYAGGTFTTAGGQTVYNIAKWTGTDWQWLYSPSGIGTDGAVNALRVFDDGGGPALYAGGQFDVAGGALANNVARWDGSDWSALSGPMGTGINDEEVLALGEYNFGAGPVLYLGGDFTTAGGAGSAGIAAWSCTSLIFGDGFDSGDTSSWSHTVR